jgi:hypothetical protein
MTATSFPDNDDLFVKLNDDIGFSSIKEALYTP